MFVTKLLLLPFLKVCYKIGLRLQTIIHFLPYSRSTKETTTCTRHQLHVCSWRRKFTWLEAKGRFPHIRPSVGIRKIDTFRRSRKGQAHVITKGETGSGQGPELQ